MPNKQPEKPPVFDVQEVEATHTPLTSAAYYIGEYCRKVNDDYMTCKAENSDPLKCVEKGKLVTKCSISLLKKLKENCFDEWYNHWECLDRKDYRFYDCKFNQQKFDECVFSKLGIKPAEYPEHLLGPPKSSDYKKEKTIHETKPFVIDN